MLPALVALGIVAASAGGYVAVQRVQHPAAAPASVDTALRNPVPSLAPSLAPSPSKVAVKASKSPAAKKTTRPPQPVQGLTQAQMNNAAVIVQVAQKRGLPRRAMLVAMMTGIQESRLRNLANTTIPASLKQSNEGTGENFDSLGIFQQRPSQGWGSVAELMDPKYAADAFYEKLERIDDWESLDLGDAAQAVQRSALPDAYDAHESQATKVVDALL